MKKPRVISPWQSSHQLIFVSGTKKAFYNSNIIEYEIIVTSFSDFPAVPMEFTQRIIIKYQNQTQLIQTFQTVYYAILFVLLNMYVL